MAKISMEDFLAKRVAKAKNKPTTADIQFDGDLITVNKPSHNVQLRYMSACGDAVSIDAQGNIVGQDIEKMFEASRDLVFACCPFLNSSSARDELGINGEPSDIVGEIFGIEGTIEIASDIKVVFDITDSAKEVIAETKN